MKTLDDINAASAAQIKHALAQDTTSKKKAATSYYGFVAQQGKNIPFLTPAQLAKAMSVSLRTLVRWREAGNGPPFMRTATHRIRYPIVDLEKWVSENVTHADSPESLTTN